MARPILRAQFEVRSMHVFGKLYIMQTELYLYMQERNATYIGLLLGVGTWGGWACFPPNISAVCHTQVARAVSASIKLGQVKQTI